MRKPNKQKQRDEKRACHMRSTQKVLAIISGIAVTFIGKISDCLICPDVQVLSRVSGMNKDTAINGINE